VGLTASYALDLPTGAAMMAAQAGCLLLAGLANALLFVGIGERRRNLRIAIDALATAVLISLLVSSAWLMIVPTGDQPMLALVESATGIGPTRFLGVGESDAYESATRDAVRFQGEVDRLNSLEKAARYQGTPLSDDEVRRIASYQKTFNEMTRGEQFVQDNHSFSVHNTLRGLHYQVGQPQGKLVRAVVGTILDVVVDLRRHSDTFGRTEVFLLSDVNKHMVWIPAGFGHGFRVVSETAHVTYKATGFYSFPAERTIVWDDPDLKIDWQLDGPPILSQKDKLGLRLRDAEVFE
jgi:dTDP-4-dehydrorhamnose 3,5-epimerase